MPARPLISDSEHEHEFVDLTSASSLQLSHRSTARRDIDSRLRQR